ncbi:MAG: InlB B-repeat-containing protein [Clostridia bacterium]|nr:InlB B-repeat-containing protein [Clostridia bacterium]
MIKRRTLIRMTRFWLALYVMIWCMTFTASASQPVSPNLNVAVINNASYVNAGGSVLSGAVIHNNGTYTQKNITAVFRSSSPGDGGSLSPVLGQGIVTDKIIVSNFSNNTAVSGGSAIYRSNGTVYISNSLFGNGEIVHTTDENAGAILSGVQSVRNTSFIWNVKNESVIEDIVGEEAWRYWDDWASVSEENPGDVWIISVLNPGETAVILLNQTVTADDVSNGQLNNTLIVGGNTPDGPSVKETTIWTKDPITITFSGLDTATNMTMHSESQIGSLPVPTRDGYEFAGWYTAPEGGRQVYWGTVFTANTTLYPRWIQKPQPNPSAVPQTGDSMNIWLYIGIGVVAVLAIVVLLRRRRE